MRRPTSMAWVTLQSWLMSHMRSTSGPMDSRMMRTRSMDSARVGRSTIAQAPQERAHGLADGLALEVPAGHVDGGEREREDAARTGAARGPAQLGRDGLDLGGILADGQAAETVHGRLEGGGEAAPEEGEADA